MPTIPIEIVLLKDWIVTLSPIWALLLIVLWKPLKGVGQSIYDKFYVKPMNEEIEVNNEQDIRLSEIEKEIEILLERQDNTKDALVALLHHELFLNSKIAIHNGSITEHELENLECLYKPYKQIGGNGTAEKLFNDCKELPIKKS